MTKAEQKKIETQKRLDFLTKTYAAALSCVAENTADIRSKVEFRVTQYNFNRYIRFHVYGKDLAILVYKDGKVVLELKEIFHSDYADNRLDSSACVKEVADRFGMERFAFVLASTVQTKDWDGRISDSNKEWAKGFPALGKHEYVCSQAHPGLINLVVNRFRKEQELTKEKKPSVLNKLKEAAADPRPLGSSLFHDAQ